MRRVAANKVYFSPSNYYRNHILEIYGKKVVNHYELKDELELTEWLGGIIIIAGEKAIAQFVDDIKQATFLPSHIDEILHYIYTSPKTTSEEGYVGNQMMALHISGIDISTGKILDKTTPLPLVSPIL